MEYKKREVANPSGRNLTLILTIPSPVSSSDGESFGDDDADCTGKSLRRVSRKISWEASCEFGVEILTDNETGSNFKRRPADRSLPFALALVLMLLDAIGDDWIDVK